MPDKAGKTTKNKSREGILGPIKYSDTKQQHDTKRVKQDPTKEISCNNPKHWKKGAAH
jgi:hypothetical protein